MSVSTLLFFAFLTALTHWMAWRNGFFQLPVAKAPPFTQPLTSIVAMGFAIYLSMNLIIAPIAMRVIASIIGNDSPVALISYLQIFILGTTLLLLFIVGLANRSTVKKIWKDSSCSQGTAFADFGMGILTWFISIPAVILISQLADIFVYYVFHVENYEQVAVRFLKMTVGSPPLFVLALIAILIFAPVIEEFLFRGLFQTWVKQKLGRKAAILIASFFFALFHLAGSQGMGNISLFISLFTLGCYLGFIYEKRCSLWASIGLHFAFNAVSTLRIIWS